MIRAMEQPKKRVFDPLVQFRLSPEDYAQVLAAADNDPALKVLPRGRRMGAFCRQATKNRARSLGFQVSE